VLAQLSWNVSKHLDQLAELSIVPRKSSASLSKAGTLEAYFVQTFDPKDVVGTINPVLKLVSGSIHKSGDL